jgi:hypothetical protein
VVVLARAVVSAPVRPLFADRRIRAVCWRACQQGARCGTAKQRWPGPGSELRGQVAFGTYAPPPGCAFEPRCAPLD